MLQKKVKIVKANSKKLILFMCPPLTQTLVLLFKIGEEKREINPSREKNKKFSQAIKL